MCVRCVRIKASKLLIEGLAPDPLAALDGLFFQKSGVAHNVQDGSPPAEHVEAALSLDLPLLVRTKFPRDVVRAISLVAETPHGGVRAIRTDTLKGLRGRATRLEGMRRCELLRVNLHCRSSAPKVHLPRELGRVLLREKLEGSFVVGA